MVEGCSGELPVETAFITNRGEVVMIRSARPEDAEGIVDSVNQVGREKIHLLVEEFPLSVEEEREYLLELDRDHNLFLVVVSGGMATGEGRIVGGIGVFQDRGGRSPKTRHLCSVGLHLIRDYRGQGIGTRLLELAVEWARQRGYLKMDASIFSTNTASLALFRKLGNNLFLPLLHIYAYIGIIME